MKDLKTQMRHAIDGVLDILADNGDIAQGVTLRGVRLGPSQYEIDLNNVEPVLKIPRDQGDSILMKRDDGALASILTDHMRFAGKVGR